MLDPSLKGKPVVVGGRAKPGGNGAIIPQSENTLTNPQKILASAPSLEGLSQRHLMRRGNLVFILPCRLHERNVFVRTLFFLRGSHRLYSEYSAKIFVILRSYSHLVEPMSLDEAFVDLTGCEKLHGPGLKTAETIRNEIRDRLGLNAFICIATNKLMAKIASAYCKPNGMSCIAPGKEQQFLAPFSIKRIPEIEPKGCARLNRMGVKSVADLSHLPLELLEETYGKWDASLYRKARGISSSEVNTETEDPRSISRETTFATDSMDPLFLESTLSYLTEKTVAQLRSHGLFARTVTLKLRYSDFKTVTHSQALG